jgi:hypothetical protein
MTLHLVEATIVDLFKRRPPMKPETERAINLLRSAVHSIEPYVDADQQAPPYALETVRAKIEEARKLIEASA